MLHDKTQNGLGGHRMQDRTIVVLATDARINERLIAAAWT